MANKRKAAVRSDDKINFDGVVDSAKGNGHFVIKIDSGQEIKCTLSGKMRTNNIKVLEGDSVEIEVSAYDTSKGMIVYRRK
jgi:translation initiation factor IF-1